MAHVVATASADADLADILDYLGRHAGHATAERYNASFEKLFSRLADYPRSGVVRTDLGSGVRVGLVLPYLVIHTYAEQADTVAVLRVLHGSSRLRRETLQLRGRWLEA